MAAVTVEETVTAATALFRGDSECTRNGIGSDGRGESGGREGVLPGDSGDRHRLRRLGMYEKRRLSECRGNEEHYDGLTSGKPRRTQRYVPCQTRVGTRSCPGRTWVPSHMFPERVLVLAFLYPRVSPHD